MFQKNVVEKIKRDILCSKLFFNRAVYELMWNNALVQDRPQMTIWRMRVGCWIPKAINTHSEYVILLLFHYDSGCTNAPEAYVKCTLPVLFYLPCDAVHFCQRISKF
jgi:hypothetical protein